MAVREFDMDKYVLLIGDNATDICEFSLITESEEVSPFTLTDKLKNINRQRKMSELMEVLGSPSQEYSPYELPSSPNN